MAPTWELLYKRVRQWRLLLEAYSKGAAITPALAPISLTYLLATKSTTAVFLPRAFKNGVKSLPGEHGMAWRGGFLPLS